MKMFLLLASISLMFTSLLHHRTHPLVSLRAASILGLVTSVTGLACLLALLGLDLWRRVLLLPYISCLVLGTGASLGYLLGYVRQSLLLRGGLQGDAKTLAALMTTVISSWALLRILAVFLIMHFPRPLPPSPEAASQLLSASPIHTIVHPTLDIPSSTQESNPGPDTVSDPPPSYSSLQDLPPSYQDFMVEKLQEV